MKAKCLECGAEFVGEFDAAHAELSNHMEEEHDD